MLDRVVARLLDDVQFYHLLFQQPLFPTREALGSRRAGQGDQFGLRRAVENSGTGGVRIILAHQRRLEALLAQLSSRAADGVDAGIQRRRDFAVRPTFACVRRVRFQQDARLRDQLRRSLARLDYRLESRSPAHNFTTYFFAPVPVPATNQLHPRPGGVATEIQKCPQVSRTRASSMTSSRDAAMTAASRFGSCTIPLAII